VPNFVFIRIKQIKTKHYAYLVENQWVRGKTKQKVKQYLGRVLHVPEGPPPVTIDSSDIVHSLITQELRHLEEEIVFDRENNCFFYKNRPVVLALNGGFLCEHTITQIHNAKNVTEEPRPGTALAQAIANAGLRIPKHAFIQLYTSNKK